MQGGGEGGNGILRVVANVRNEDIFMRQYTVRAGDVIPLRVGSRRSSRCAPFYFRRGPLCGVLAAFLISLSCLLASIWDIGHVEFVLSCDKLLSALERGDGLQASRFVSLNGIAL